MKVCCSFAVCIIVLCSVPILSFSQDAAQDAAEAAALSNALRIEERASPVWSVDQLRGNGMMDENDESNYESLPYTETNCTANVYTKLEKETSAQTTTYEDVKNNAQTLPVRYWYPEEKCYIFIEVMFQETDAIGAVASRAAEQTITHINPETAHFWLEGTRLYNNKYMRYFISSIYNGGVLTLKDEPPPKNPLGGAGPFSMTNRGLKWWRQ